MPQVSDAARPAVPHFVQVHQEDASAIRAELVLGLTAMPPHIAPKYFYDALGSRLFDAITALQEYYPTRTESAIFSAHAAAMSTHVAPGTALIDLGAGNCAKAASLFAALRPGAYVALDISVGYLREALNALQQRHPALPMLGLGLDFFARSGLARCRPSLADRAGRWQGAAPGLLPGIEHRQFFAR